MKKTVKCRYSHCNRFHDTKDIPIEEAVLSGKNQYYHPDCYKESVTMRNIIDMFQKYINEHVVFSSLRQVINNIIYDKNCEADFLEFGLKYYIKNHIPLNYPGGLYYVIQNKDVNKAWNKYKAVDTKAKIQEITEEDMISEIDNIPKIKYMKTPINNRFSKILGKG